ncbi:MAG: hypothetical protein ABJC26_05950 [Gemmatimonadaceae bacterium]
MREYRWQATEEAVEALRRLRGAWLGYTVEELQVTVYLADGDAITIAADTVDVEGVFDAYRLTAVRTKLEKLLPTELESGAAFANGGSDVVLFSGVSWSEPSNGSVREQFGEGASLNFSGHTGQLSDTAEIVCITTDSMVVATNTGEGLLIRTGLKPESLDVVNDQEAVRKFLIARGYASDE